MNSSSDAWRDFNLNEFVQVRLNSRGHQILRENYERSMGPLVEKYPYTPPAADDDGWVRIQGWQFMQEFGCHMGLTLKPPFDLTIRIPAPAKGDA